MSTPTTKVAVPGSRRGRFPRLRDFRVRSKLGLILAVPIAAIVTLSAVSLVDAGQRAVTADDVSSLAQLSADASDLVHQLQTERVHAVNLVTKVEDAAAYKATHNATDVAVDTYAQRRKALGGLQDRVTAKLKPVDEGIKDLTALRAEVLKYKDPDGIALGAAVFRYDVLIDSLLTMREVVWQTGDNTVVTAEVRAAAAFSRAKEYAAQEQTIVLGSLFPDHKASAAQFRAYQVATASQQAALKSFDDAATPVQREIFVREVGGPASREVERLESQLNEAMADTQLTMGAGEWVLATSTKLGQMRKAEGQLDRQASADAVKALNDVRGKVITEAALVISTLLIAVVLTLVVARSMVRSLRQLREAAIGVAYEGLPKAVARLSDPEVAGEANPETIAAQLEDPLLVRGRDEFGQVAQAFNVVHREAVRIAAEQAVLRANVSTMFVNLARRSQILVDRLIGHLDRLEKGEEDPDRLAALFQLDHLATRMRRNDENLLVLAGADSTRIQRDPAPLGDVLRAAQSEVEHYTRIEFGVIDRDLEISPHAVNDLVHLVAELFDNATAFSPPDTAVVVDARRFGDKAILQVEDRGIGISTDQLAALNERLAKPPTVDVAVSRMMGLVVVARLASRHGVRVELQAARERGVIAQVLLPVEVLAGTGARGNARSDRMALPAPTGALALEGTVRNSGQTFGNIPAPTASLFELPASRNGSATNGSDLASAFGGPRISDQAPREPDVFPALGSLGAGASSLPPVSTARTAPAWHDLTGSGGNPPVAPGDDAPVVEEHDQPTGRLPMRRPGVAAELPSGEWPSLTEPTKTDAAVADATTGAPVTEPADDAVAEQPAAQVIPRQLPSSPEVPAADRQPTPPAQATPPAPAAEPPPSGLLGLVAPSVPDAVSPYAPAAPPGQRNPAAKPADLTFELPKITDAAPVAPAVPTAQPARPAVEPAAAAPERTATEPAAVAEPAAGQPVSPVIAALNPQSAATSPEAQARPEAETGSEAPAETPATTPAAGPAPVAAAPVAAVSDELSAPATPATPADDDSMGLLIFQEMESAWFSTHEGAPELYAEPEPWSFDGLGLAEVTAAVDAEPVIVAGTPTEPVVSTQITESAASAPVEASRVQEVPVAVGPSTTPTHNVPPRRVSPTPPPGSTTAAPAAGATPTERWQTAADRGWQAASAAAAPQTAGTTETGLPKRVPMAQLVPGGVGASVTATDKRSPEAVRGLLSAYHRGVQRGRQRPGGTGPGEGAEPAAAESAPGVDRTVVTPSGDRPTGKTSNSPKSSNVPPGPSQDGAVKGGPGKEQKA